MSERGVFAVDRGIWDHPAFDDEPFTQREAWIWLVGEATHRPRTKKIDGADVQLTRGQLGHSVRFMATAWQWSKSRVDRFLRALENRDMIAREIGTRTSVITICNYNDYQRVSLPERDNVGTISGTRAGQQRDKLEDTENTKENLLCDRAGKKAPAKARDDQLVEAFERLRKAYPKREGQDPRQPALKAFTKAMSAGADVEQIISGAAAFAEGERKRGTAGTPYIPHLSTWLNGKRWQDSQPAPAKAKDDAANWRVPVQNWQRDPSTWTSHAWGPPPGEPGCKVPAGVLANLGVSARPGKDLH